MGRELLMLRLVSNCDLLFCCRRFELQHRSSLAESGLDMNYCFVLASGM